MTIKLFCKSCKDTISPKQIYEIVACKCGKTEVKALVGKGYAVKGEVYALVDDEGNEIVPETIVEPLKPQDTTEPPIISNKGVIEALMQNLGHQIEAMESLSSAGQYSPATNRDLLVVLIWVQGFAKTVCKELGLLP